MAKQCEFMFKSEIGQCYCDGGDGDVPRCGDRTKEGGACSHPERTCHLCLEWDKKLKKCKVAA